jgi:hypothetical protein
VANKLTAIFAVTTAPTNLSAAAPHSGGWSESWWQTNNYNFTIANLQAIAQVRAGCLPKQASIIGFRQALYVISGNKLLPNGASVTRVNVPGNAAYTTDLPQCSLELSGQANGAINSNRFRMGCLPDEQISFGEYQPTVPYGGSVATFLNMLSTGQTLGNNVGTFGFPGRDLTQPSVRVVSLTAGGVLTTSAPLAVVNNVTYIRLHRVYDVLGNPVKGSYLASNIAANQYQLQGTPGQTVSKPSGTARVDAVVVFNYASVTISRAVVKKIGRPSQGYRGRRSNLTPA